MIFTYEGELRGDYKTHTVLSTLRFNFGGSPSSSAKVRQPQPPQPVYPQTYQQPVVIQQPAPAQMPAIQHIEIGNIYFNTGVSDLGPNARKYLADNAGLLRSAGRITIHGHSDSQEVNGAKVSEERARKTTAYLASLGISADKIRYKGFGATQPAQSDSTADGRSLNRRVEFIIE